MAAVGAVGLHWVDRVSRAAEGLSAYFSRIPPTPFLYLSPADLESTYAIENAA